MEMADFAIEMNRPRSMSAKDRKIIFASSLGTVFEWYDFYLYGSLAGIISRQFFSGINETAGFVFALLAFAAGFAVRPFGALFFGRIGDTVGRKYTFLITIMVMGASTFLVGLLPGYASVGIVAPVALIALRLMQGLALGGEYGPETETILPIGARARTVAKPPEAPSPSPGRPTPCPIAAPGEVAERAARQRAERPYRR
jgi:hypothetical protein